MLARSRCHYSSLRRATRCMSMSNPDWDLDALNDEMEGLIGKFDDSDVSPPGLNASTPPPSSIPSGMQNRSTVSSEMSTTHPLHSSLEIKSSSTHVPPLSKEPGESMSYGKPVYTLFQFNDDAQHFSDSFSSDVASVKCKRWQNYKCVDALMAELAENSIAGVILLQGPTGTLTQTQKNLLKIFKKSTPVAAVIEKIELDRHSEALASSTSAPHDTSYATCVIRGLKAEHGVAAAIAGLNSLISEHTKTRNE